MDYLEKITEDCYLEIYAGYISDGFMDIVNLNYERMMHGFNKVDVIRKKNYRYRNLYMVIQGDQKVVVEKKQLKNGSSEKFLFHYVIEILKDFSSFPIISEYHDIFDCTENIYQNCNGLEVIIMSEKKGDTNVKFLRIKVNSKNKDQVNEFIKGIV